MPVDERLINDQHLKRIETRALRRALQEHVTIFCHRNYMSPQLVVRNDCVQLNPEFDSFYVRVRTMTAIHTVGHRSRSTPESVTCRCMGTRSTNSLSTRRRVTGGVAYLVGSVTRLLGPRKLPHDDRNVVDGLTAGQLAQLGEGQDYLAEEDVRKKGLVMPYGEDHDCTRRRSVLLHYARTGHQHHIEHGLHNAYQVDVLFFVLLYYDY